MIIYKTKEITREKTKEKSSDIILEMMKHNPTVTSEELCEITGLSIQGVEWNLRKLRAEGKIKRIGPDKGGHWEVK